jgi:anti-sigma factor RsiW
MPCNRIIPQLNALADGELNRFQAGRIRRHLRHCAACAEELVRIQEIGAQARQWRAISAPSDALQARVVQALTKSPVGEAVLPHSTKELSTMQISNSNALPMQPNADRLSGQAPALRLLGRSWRPVAALSLAGIALGFLAVSLMPTHKTFAFAAVVQAMQRVKTIHWRVQSNGFTQPGASLESQNAVVKMETWARLDKPAYVTLITPDGSGRTMIAAGKMITILDNKVVAEMPMPNFAGKDPEKALRAYILSQVVSPFKDIPAAADPGLQPDGSDNSIKSEETILNGQSVIRFYGGWKNATWKFNMSLWVDPKTHLVLRSESVMSNPVAGQADLHMIADQFRYNEEPPAGIFDVPQGKAGIPTIKMPQVAPPQVARPRS